MSSESSEGEDLEKYREAADSEFIKDAMYKKHGENTVLEIEKLPSLRRTKDDDEQFNLFRVTPEFRNYIAKHLTSHLDQQLQYENNSQVAKPKRRKSGIKLFKNSTKHVKIDVPIQVIRKRPKQNDSDEDTDKFKSTAVSPADILSKNDIKHWSNRSKAPVYTYLKTKHGLILK